MKKSIAIGALIIVILAAIAPGRAEVVLDFLWQAGVNIVGLIQG